MIYETTENENYWQGHEIATAYSKNECKKSKPRNEVHNKIVQWFSYYDIRSILMKRFNITGTCIAKENYMVDTSNKIKQIIQMIENKDYFVINRPRQYGKTTTLSLLRRELLKRDDYLAIFLSFEGIGDSPFDSSLVFSKFFLKYTASETNVKNGGYRNLFLEKIETTDDFFSLSEAITEILTTINKKVVLVIDEVDRSSNNDLFLHFLGMLRDKYLKAKDELDTTFHSVILAGVHDIKTLKLKIKEKHPQALSSGGGYNSPWNIAVDFKVDLSFKPPEIATMLTDYVNATGNQMDIPAISERIHLWTNGYPFLVSKLCKIIDEEFLPSRQLQPPPTPSNLEGKEWTVSDIDEAVRQLLGESNTLFDDMIKNLENNEDLYKIIRQMVLGLEDFVFDISVPLINLGSLYGLIVQNGDKKAKIHNKIFEEKLTSYIVLKNKLKMSLREIEYLPSQFIKNDGRLDFDKLMLKFQEGIKEKHSKSDVLHSKEFLEKDLRLLFCMFVKGIINGIGHCFKEVQTGQEQRLDIVVLFKDEKFVVELKIWKGPEYHAEGIAQLKKYLNSESVTKGYMLIADKRTGKEFRSEVEDNILMVYV